METQTRKEQSLHLRGAVAALVIAFLFYPMTIAPTGQASNGGALGLGSLVIALLLAWRAFALNMQSPWVRRLFHLPLAAVVTFLVIREAYAQFVSGRWFWL